VWKLWGSDGEFRGSIDQHGGSEIDTVDSLYLPFLCYYESITGVYRRKGSMRGELVISVVIHGGIRIHCLCFTYIAVFTVSLER